MNAITKTITGGIVATAAMTLLMVAAPMRAGSLMGHLVYGTVLGAFVVNVAPEGKARLA